MLWINFLHFYQPSTVDNETIVEATDKSYRRIIAALKRNQRIRMTANIAGCLLEKWQALGYEWLIRDIKQLVKRGQIELTGSAAYHPLLPFLPDDEIKLQIRLDSEIIRKNFGQQPLSGFFIPEATYDQRVAKLIKRLHFKWILLDEISAAGRINGLDYRIRHKDHYSGLTLCFRSRSLSRRYVPHAIMEIMKTGGETMAVTATDAELYGLRHNDVRGNFEKILRNPKLSTKTVSAYLSELENEKVIKPVASSWESTAEELKKGVPYHLWRDPKNKIQERLWELAGLAIRTVNRRRRDLNFRWARTHLYKGLSSCTFWWASARDFRLFGPISWNPDEIERGTNELVRSIRALDDVTTRQTKIKAEKLYLSIKRMVWQKHWRYYWKK